jgi:hypothetical protein
VVDAIDCWDISKVAIIKHASDFVMPAILAVLV